MKKFLTEFKAFIAGGDMIELAVAVILAGAIGNVINLFTKNVMMPIVAAIFGQPDFDALSIKIGDAHILYGSVITAIIALVLTGLVLFAIIKAYNKMKKEQPAEAAGPTEVDLLTEIRDSLRSR